MALAHNPTVFVIDDDASIRASIQGLLKSEGLRSDVLSRCTAGTPERYDATPGYACRVSNGRDQHLSVISTLIAVSPSASKPAQEIATSFSER